MRLLVSVASAADAEAALTGGADLIDAKDPSRGALGAVPVATLHEINRAVAGARPVTAALGTADNEDEIEHAARTFTQAATTFVKIGFTEGASAERVEALIAAAVRGASHAHGGVVAVAYADARRAEFSSAELIDSAARAGARGVLLDTADKRGRGLLQLMTPPLLERWIARAQQAGLFAAVAGKLAEDDLPVVRDAGADIAGVRGAACEGGREGRIAAHKVRAMTVRLSSTSLGPGKADTTYHNDVRRVRL